MQSGQSGQSSVCTHAYVRGERKGTVCGVKLRSDTCRKQGLCSVHCSSTKERNLASCRKLAADNKGKLFKVEIDNVDQSVFKKMPEGVVVKVVHQTRALQLQKLGGVITAI